MKKIHIHRGKTVQKVGSIVKEFVEYGEMEQDAGRAALVTPSTEE